jgi:uncharacterized protein (TIGR02594 family)
VGQISSCRARHLSTAPQQRTGCARLSAKPFIITACNTSGRRARRTRDRSPQLPPASNLKVIEYLKSVSDFKAENDNAPWSSAFVNWVLQRNKITGTRSILDKPWLTWGRSVSPEPGCIATFQWQDGAYHVAFAKKSDQAAVAAIGGNVRVAPDFKSSVSTRVYPRCRMPT